MNDDDVVVSGVRGREAVEELRRNHTQPTRKSAQQSATNTVCWQGTSSKRLVVGLNNEHKEAVRDSRSLTASLRVLWRCPTLPQPVGCSTIGAAGLSFQVRNGGWAFPRCYDHHKNWCSTRSPTVWGVWVDRGLYSGCGSVFTDSCWSPGLLGVCLVLAH